MHVTAAYNDDK